MLIALECVKVKVLIISEFMLGRELSCVLDLLISCNMRC